MANLENLLNTALTAASVEGNPQPTLIECLENLSRRYAITQNALSYRIARIFNALGHCNMKLTKFDKVLRFCELELIVLEHIEKLCTALDIGLGEVEFLIANCLYAMSRSKIELGLTQESWPHRLKCFQFRIKGLQSYPTMIAELGRCYLDFSMSKFVMMEFNEAIVLANKSLEYFNAADDVNGNMHYIRYQAERYISAANDALSLEGGLMRDSRWTFDQPPIEFMVQLELAYVEFQISKGKYDHGLEVLNVVLSWPDLQQLWMLDIFLKRATIHLYKEDRASAVAALGDCHTYCTSLLSSDFMINSIQLVGGPILRTITIDLLAKRFSQAIELAERFISVVESRQPILLDFLGEAHELTARVLMEHAVDNGVDTIMFRLEKAKDYFKESYGAQHCRISLLDEYIGQLHLKVGNNMEALVSLERAKSAYDESSDANPLNDIRISKSLVKVYQSLERYEDAISTQRHVIDLLQNLGDVKHHDLLDITSMKLVELFMQQDVAFQVGEANDLLMVIEMDHICSI